MSWGNPNNIFEETLSKLLKPAACAWELGSHLKLRSYKMGLLKRHTASVPVISIGNLSCGGTGKTPITIDLARRLIQAGMKVAILSRGYRRQSREAFVVVSDGTKLHASAAEAGDEPYMMAQAVPQAVVLVGAKRAATAEMAVKLYNCNVILLDDGFQHLAMNRNHDIVLLDYHDDPLKDSLLPAGRLREPVGALARAHYVAITKVPANVNPERMEYFQYVVRSQAPNAQLTACRFIPYRLRSLQGDSLSPDQLSGMRITSFSGIARPESLYGQLSELGAQVIRARSFSDHHWFNAHDLEAVGKDFRTAKADIIVTTQKDAARLNTSVLSQWPIYVLELSTQWMGKVPAIDAVCNTTDCNPQHSQLVQSPDSTVKSADCGVKV